MQFNSHHSEICGEKRSWYRLKTGRIRKEGQRRKGIQDEEKQGEEGQLLLKKEHKISIVDVLGRQREISNKISKFTELLLLVLAQARMPVYILYLTHLHLDRLLRRKSVTWDH